VCDRFDLKQSMPLASLDAARVCVENEPGFEFRE